ncbi:MAG TPA: hypothetical protein VFZ61_30675 [Polyangiales bacterium]
MSPSLSSRAVLALGLLLSSLALGCGADDPDAELSDGAITSNPDAAITADSATPPAAVDAGSADAGGGASDTGTSVSQDASTPTADASQPSDASSSDASRSDASASDASTTDASAPDSGLAKFSFFVTSEAAIRELSKDPEGFGGDLRYGETGAGAGLRGADKLCATIAERSMAGAGKKQWRAFLSASTDGAGMSPVHARDRIGQGPWYDRKGRLVGNTLADLISGNRPSQADVQIRNDLPNETGTGNHAPDGTQVDNHDTLTGSDANGRYVSGANTCMDWTTTTNSGGGGGGGGGGSGPNIGHSWPRSSNNGANWISDHRAGGCAKGINTMNGSTDGTATVGAGGGYGGFYCFALTP